MNYVMNEYITIVDAYCSENVKEFTVLLVLADLIVPVVLVGVIVLLFLVVNQLDGNGFMRSYGVRF